MPKNTLSKFINKHYKLIVIIGLLMFTTMSLIIGLNQSVWFDEAYSINLAKKTLGNMLTATSVDVHPPLYYAFLHVWGGTFGFSELSLRISSVLTMSLAILLMIKLIKKRFNIKIALWTLSFLIFSPMLIRYGFEIRMYAMGTFWAILSTILLLRAIKSNRLLDYCLYGFVVTLGQLTHNFLIFVWLSQLFYLIYINWPQKDFVRHILKQKFWLAYVFAVLLYLPWLPFAVKQISLGALTSVTEILNFQNLAGILSFNLFYQPVWQLDSIKSVILLILLAVFITQIPKIWQKTNKSDKILLFLFFVPIILLFIICLFKPTYLERYLTYQVPFLLALMAIELQKTQLKWGILLFLMMGALNLTAIGNFNFQRMEQATVKQVSQIINTKTNYYVISDPYLAIEMEYYTDQFIYINNQYYPIGGYYPSNDFVQTRGRIPFKRFKYLTYNEIDQTILTDYEVVKEESVGRIKIIELGEKQ